jgi:alpha-amylase
MPHACFYFQVHQPHRLGRYSLFDVGHRHDYFDNAANKAILRKVADKCYLPANARMLDLVRRFEGRFRIAYSLSGVFLEQVRMWTPEVLASFQALAETGCVEFMGETFYHSLAALKNEDEFREQVEEHAVLTEKLFGRRPTFFRNTELIYNDRIGEIVDDLGFVGVAAEGADDVLGWRSPTFAYHHPQRDLVLLLKNYRLSDDIAFRFSNPSWPEYPLTADKFSEWLHAISGNGDIVNLFMDYETFGEHQWASTGIFEFIDALPGQVLRDPEWAFITPTEAATNLHKIAPMPFPRTVSWADTERDVTAWLGNGMQHDAFDRLYAMGAQLRERNNPEALKLWRRLQTSDHFYYMCTKWFADGDVHAYFSPYENPYDAYITYMNVLEDLRRSVLWADSDPEEASVS